jgi:membrane protease YdiL (CAAX protease family)
MLGIFVALAISSLLLHFFEKENILALGFRPISKRAIQFLLGFTVTAILCLNVQYLESLLKSSNWYWRDNAGLTFVIDRLWWDFKSVLTEELIFRGAILFILLRRVGRIKSVLISAAAFGVYHWFSFGIFGNIIPMFFVFIGTGLMGYSFALAFVKTRSIFLPLGLHLGWNFTFNTIFSRGPLGEGLILSTGGTLISDWYSLIGLWAAPIVVILFVKYIVPAESCYDARHEMAASAKKEIGQEKSN